MHGVTQYSSGLIYEGESGALNEAFSDIIGASIERSVKGTSVMNTWLLGEEVFTPSSPGDALRNMANPSETGGFDFYPERYQGTEDNGGVHLNSGIANLAFVLLVQGGSHPRGMTSNQVSPIDSDFDVSLMEAAEIFYNANTACLTPTSGFAAMRHCTATVHGGSYTDSIHAAWEAVGVLDESTTTSLSDGTPLAITLTDNVQHFVLEGIGAGESVTCSLAGSDGDADLYVRFGTEPVVDSSSMVNDCISTSETSNEECTTGAATEDTMLHVSVHTYMDNVSSGLTIICTSNQAY